VFDPASEQNSSLTSIYLSHTTVFRVRYMAGRFGCPFFNYGRNIGVTRVTAKYESDLFNEP